MRTRLFSKPLSHFPPQRTIFNFSKIFTKHLSTDNNNLLQGLVDPDFKSTEIDQFPHQAPESQSFIPQEFTFLRETLKSSSKVDAFEVGETPRTDSFSIIDGIETINDGFKEKTQKFLRQFREKLDEHLVIDVLKNVKTAELGVKFFMWAGRQIGYSHSLAVYNALLDLLECSYSKGGMRLPDHFICEIRDDDKDVLRIFLNLLVQKCCRKGLWSLALEEVGRLKSFGYKPSRGTYNTLVLVFLNVERLEMAALIHKEMSDAGFKLDSHTLNCFVYWLCKVGKWTDALELIKREDFVPDTVIYTNMIKGLCEASLFEVAMDFLNRMRSCSCIPNNATYDVLLCACLNKNKLGRCKRILSMMITEGCYPSRKVFNSLVHAFCKTGEYSYAYKLLKKMAECGYQPGYVAYNILIGGICGKEELPALDGLELAEKAYNEMLDKGVLLNKVNVSNFARCLCGAGKFDKAFNIIREMMSKGFAPDTSTYSRVIEFLCNAFKVDKAVLLFQDMKRNGIVPDVYT